MKKWMWYCIGLILILGIASGFFVNHMIKASSYKNNMQNGRTEIKEQRYDRAHADLKQAVKIKPDSIEANNLLSQLNKFINAENDFNDYKFKQAMNSFKMVMSYDKGSSILKERAKSESSQIKPATKNVSRFEKIYKQALTQNQLEEFDASNVTLKSIFNDDLASNTFYSKIIKKAKKLKNANNRGTILGKPIPKKDKQKPMTASNDTSTPVNSMVRNSTITHNHNVNPSNTHQPQTVNYKVSNQTVDNSDSSGNHSDSNNSTEKPTVQNNSNNTSSETSHNDTVTSKPNNDSSPQNNSNSNSSENSQNNVTSSPATSSNQ